MATISLAVSTALLVTLLVANAFAHDSKARGCAGTETFEFSHWAVFGYSKAVSQLPETVSTDHELCSPAGARSQSPRSKSYILGRDSE